MLSFFTKKTMLLTFLCIGTLIGAIRFFLDPSRTITRIEYVYPSSIENNLPAHLQKDTFFRFQDDLYVRNYPTSIGDTLRKKDIHCHELKIQSRDALTAKELKLLESQLIGFKEISINRIKHAGKIYATAHIYLWGIAGLFIAVLFIKIIRPIKNAGTELT